jgi:hypothetical protein
MEASVVDLRYKMADVLKALERQEPVRIKHRGKLKGIIQPVGSKGKTPPRDHPFFKMRKGEKVSVEKEMERLRGRRYDVV